MPTRITNHRAQLELDGLEMGINALAAGSFQRAQQPVALWLNYSKRRHSIRSVCLSQYPSTPRRHCTELITWPPAGGLVAFGPNLVNPFRRAARYVSRILRGARSRPSFPS